MIITHHQHHPGNILAGLIEKSTDVRVIKAVIKILEEWIKNKVCAAKIHFIGAHVNFDYSGVDVMNIEHHLTPVTKQCQPTTQPEGEDFLAHQVCISVVIFKYGKMILNINFFYFNQVI